MALLSVSFTAPLWEYEGPAAWFFVSLPPEVADEIADLVADRATAFGSVRVGVRVGGTQWSTSLFPDKQRETYVLPMKRAVREAEGLVEGGAVPVQLEVLAT